MRPRGYVPPQPTGRGPAGRPLCRGCHAEVPQGRRSWCSNQCAEHAFIRAGHGGMVRALVFERDKGVCARCQADAGKVERILYRLERARQRASTRENWASAEEAKRFLRELFGRGKYDTRSLWEADHVVGLADGGRGVLDRLRDPLLGYRTLCVPCHIEVTREAAQRRAAERRAQRQSSKTAVMVPTGTEGSAS